ncbi:MAG: chemotaxis protein CheW [Chloroflexia bacterium]
MAEEGITALFLKTRSDRFAVEAGQVEALRRKETLYPARNGPPDLLGFLALGEAAIPVLDLEIRLGLATPGERKRGILLILPPDIAPLSFRVDDVEGPVTLPWKQITLLPDLLREVQPRPLVWGLVWQEDILLPLLDLGQVIPPEEISMLLSLAPIQDR